MLEWPRSAASVTMSMPDSAARVAQVCRRSYSRNAATLLSLTARSWALFTFGTGHAASVSHGTRYGVSSPSMRRARTLRTAVVNGTRRRTAHVLGLNPINLFPPHSGFQHTRTIFSFGERKLFLNNRRWYENELGGWQVSGILSGNAGFSIQRWCKRSVPYRRCPCTASQPGVYGTAEAVLFPNRTSTTGR